MSAVTTRSQPRRTATLAAAMLLAASGGLLDATAYLGHGHVFVTNMTGNAVLMGIAVAARDLPQVVRHLDVIAGFILGLVASELSRARAPNLAYRFAIALEMVIIGLVGWFAASLPLLLILPMLSIVSAFQIATFRRVGPFYYNSTFITGNLRDMVQALVDRRFSHDSEDRVRARRQALDLGLICAAFLAGAVAGACLEPRFPVHSLWFAEAPLVPVMVLALMQGPRKDVQQAPKA